MKKIALILAVLTLTLCACKKAEKPNSSVYFQDDVSILQEQEKTESNTENENAEPEQGSASQSDNSQSGGKSSKTNKGSAGKSSGGNSSGGGSGKQSSGGSASTFNYIPKNSTGLSAHNTGSGASYRTYDKLTATQKRLYDVINNAVINMASGYQKLGSCSFRDVSIAFNSVQTDFPEYFWMPFSFYCSESSGEYEISFTNGGVEYNCTASERTAMQSRIDSVVNQIISGIPSGGSDYDIELYLHDWLSKNVSYRNGGISTHDYTVYGALVDKTAVCEGYSRAMQLLCKRLSIPCTLVKGASVVPGSSNKIGHMWNKIRIGGEWYNLDVTWDGNNHGICLHGYFNLSDSAILIDHDFDPDASSAADSVFTNGDGFNVGLPAGNSSKYSYASINNNVITGDIEKSKNILRSRLLDAVKNGETSAEFFLDMNGKKTISGSILENDFNLPSCLNDVNKESGKNVRVNRILTINQYNSNFALIFTY